MSIFVDEDGGCMMGTMLPPPPGFVPPTIAKSLEYEFGEEVYFYDLNGRPVALFGLMDYAEDWSKYPIREVHPFVPLKYGKGITEEEFRTMVKAMHGLGEDDIPG